jgi:Protein of unknown function VcgC/VcgE (DUF2780)
MIPLHAKRVQFVSIMKLTLHRLFNVSAAISLCALIALAGVKCQAQTSTTGLVSQLSKSLAITPTQARGGAGSLFAMAKTRLSADEFSKVSSAVPGMSRLLGAAPAVEKPSELSSLESSMGGMGNVGRTIEVAEAFHKLGLPPEMIVKFVPVMTKYVESRGGSDTAALLEKALK